MSDIVKLYSRLSLRDDERKAASTGGAGAHANDMKRFLVAKVLAPRRIPHSNISGVFSNLWGVNGKVTSTPLEENTVLFDFSNPVDKERVLEREPWVFDKDCKFLVALTEPKSRTTGSDLRFDKATFWIHVHNVPWAWKNEVMAKRIGDAIGRFVEVEKDIRGDMMGSYLRMRCEIDILKPLKRVQAFEELEEEFPIRYEKLPYYCTFCGFIGHARDDCASRLRAPRNEREEEHYPSFIRANPNMSPFPKDQRRGGTFMRSDWDSARPASSRMTKNVAPAPAPPEQLEQNVTPTETNWILGFVDTAANQSADPQAEKVIKPGPARFADLPTPDPDWWIKRMQQEHDFNRMTRGMVEESMADDSYALAESNHGAHVQARKLVRPSKPVVVEELEDATENYPGMELTDTQPPYMVDSVRDDIQEVDVRGPVPAAAVNDHEIMAVASKAAGDGQQVTLMNFTASALVITPKKSARNAVDPLSPSLVPVPIALDTPARMLEAQKDKISKARNKTVAAPRGRGRGKTRGRGRGVEENESSAKRKLRLGDDLIFEEYSGSMGNKRSKLSVPVSDASSDQQLSIVQAETGNVAQSRPAQ